MSSSATAYDLTAKRFVEDGVTHLHNTDLNNFGDDLRSDLAITVAAPLAKVGQVISLAQNGATIGQTLTWDGGAWVPATPAAGGGGTTYTPGTGLTLVGNQFAVDLGGGANQAAPGNHTHSIYQLISQRNQANGYLGLDGSAQFAPGFISASGAANGQIMTLTGGVAGWANAPTGGVTYNGTAPITVTGSVIAVATATNSQLGVSRPDGTTITVSAGVLTAVGGGGGSGLPTAVNATLDGTSGQTVINPTHTLVYLAPGVGFSQAAPAPYTLANGAANKHLELLNLGPGWGNLALTLDGAGATIAVPPLGSFLLFYDNAVPTYRIEASYDPGSTIAAQPVLPGGPASGDATLIERAGAAYKYDPFNFALKASPVFTGTPMAPTPAAGNSTTLLATTAFVQAAISGIAGGGGVTLAVAGTDPVPTMDGAAAVGASARAAREDHVHPSDTSRVPLANIPAATGQLLGGSGVTGQAVGITLGTGLSFSGTTLNAAPGGGSSGPVTPQVITSGASVAISNVHDLLVVVNKTTGSATALALFASPVPGTRITVKDGKGDASTNNITITPAAGTIEGAANFVIRNDREAVTMTYTGTEWSTV